jgi:hypothetical protein
MDPIIQSQIQSPLVRTLQSIPTNSNNFVHGIPDNTPPFSKHQVKLKPHNTLPGDLNGTFKFNIPQNGHLNRVYLRYRQFGHKEVTNNSVTNHRTDTPFSFGEAIEWIQLRTHNNVIQTIHASSIPFEVASISKTETTTKQILQGLVGYVSVDSTNTDILPVPTMNVPTFNSSTTQISDDVSLAAKDYLIPIPFSSTYYLKDNLQTRLMEDLEVVVKMRPGVTQVLTAGGTSATPFSRTDEHELELSVDFINYHENVEEVIRNENFKPDIPAALLQSDNLLYKATFDSTKEAGTFGTQHLYTADLNTDALVSDIFIASKVFPSSRAYERYESFNNVAYYFELVSGGNVILSGLKGEFDGIESVNYSTVTRQHQNEGVLPLRYTKAGTHIRLALNNTDEYFDGGISFQSLVTPQLRIYLTYSTAVNPSFAIDEGAAETGSLNVNPSQVEFDVVLKRKVMLRIDGNTGKISKSLES